MLSGKQGAEDNIRLQEHVMHCMNHASNQRAFIIPFQDTTMAVEGQCNMSVTLLTSSGQQDISRDEKSQTSRRCGQFSMLICSTCSADKILRERLAEALAEGQTLPEGTGPVSSPPSSPSVPQSTRKRRSTQVEIMLCNFTQLS